MLVTKEVWIELNPNNINYFEDKGYKIPRAKSKKNKMQVVRGTKILVKVNDLQDGSHAIIEILCDYCLENGIETTIQREWKMYFKRNKNAIINKDCCDSCRHKKVKESNQSIYGVDSIFELSEKREKIKSTNLLRYGHEIASKNSSIINKAQNTMLEKYGTLNLYSIPEIRQKAINSNLNKYGTEWQMQSDEVLKKAKETFFHNQNYQCSKQQKYLYYLLGGELNYSIDRLSLDIAFPKSKIYIEYDGGGHNLQVKLGNMSEIEFNQKEFKRYLFLKSLGWKCIKIISDNDYLPSDKVIVDEFNKALKWLSLNNKGHYHYNIIIDKNNNTYGELRKIKEEDLVEVG